MAAYVGKYDRTSADKYDEFLSELGVNMLMRKAATASTPVFEVNINCYVISVKWQNGRRIILCESGGDSIDWSIFNRSDIYIMYQVNFFLQCEYLDGNDGF